MKKGLLSLAAAATLAVVALGGPAVGQYYNMGDGNQRPPTDALNFSPVPPGQGVGTAPTLPPAAAAGAMTMPLPVPSDYSIPGTPPPARAQAPSSNPQPNYAPPQGRPLPPGVQSQAGYPVAPPNNAGVAATPAPSAQPDASFDWGAAQSPPITTAQQNAVPAAPPPAVPPAAQQNPGYFQMGPAPPQPPRSPYPAQATAQPRLSGPASPTRFIVPYEKLRLEGEIDARSWVVFLTQDEAAKASTLLVGYINSVMVMPEASRLRVSINGQPVLDTPISSSSAPARISVSLPPGIVRPGGNTLRMEAQQRHRTDCNYQATYELWTDIVSDMTGLTFGSGTALRTLNDLPAVGLDGSGQTNIRMIVAGGMNTVIGDRILRLGQAIAVRGRYPHPIVTVTDRTPAPAPGALDVMVGPAADLARSLGSSFPGASNRALVTFLNDPRFTVPTLVVTGLTWSDIDSTIAQIEEPLLQPNENRDRFYDTASWLAPNVPILTGSTSLHLSDLDIQTQEFSGRRFHMRFAIGLPVDFYASAYGQAMLYLDAAYSNAVRQSSHFDVYVNGNIASTVDLDAGQGDILRHAPVKIPLKHFRPGVNEITLEAILVTADDARCGPAATLPGANRLVLFNTTEFWMPAFARIARLPSLDAFSATGFPYNKAEVTALVLGKSTAQNYSAAGTLLARVARSAGRPIPVDSSATLQTIGDRPALVVGLASELQPDVFSDFAVAESARNEWVTSGVEDQGAALPSRQRPQGTAQLPEQATGTAPQGFPDVFSNENGRGNRQVYDRWNESLAGGRGLRGEVERIGDWFEDTFDLSSSSLRLFNPVTQAFDPGSNVSVFLAQQDSSGGTSPWTLLTARSPQAMQGGLARLTAPEVWSGVAGRVSGYEPGREALQIEPATDFHFVVTEGLGFSNARLILANWMSTNIVIYALSVLVFCIVLGAGTSELLGRIGRRR